MRSDDAVMFDINTLDAASVGLHELYLSHVRAGFTKKQALRLVMHQLRIANDSQPQD